MASINQKVATPPPRTHEGTIAARITPTQELRRTLLACLLWEDTFYESGVDVATRLATLTADVPAPEVYRLALEARTQMKLRHAPLLVARALAARKPVPQDFDLFLADLIQRPDELTEFLAIYWQGQAPAERQPLAAAVKRGLAWAFQKFDAYRLAKYNRAGAVTLRDVLFLVHGKPKTVSLGRWTKAERKGTAPTHPARAETPDEALYRQLAEGTLPAPDTWEVALSAGQDKKATWERLMGEGKLGALALLRNLRNMEQADVDRGLIKNALATANVARVLPFRFVAAAAHAPSLEPDLEAAMFRALAETPKLPGRTAFVIDTSPSMWEAKVSGRSEMTRFDAAAALCILGRELCADVRIYAFNERAYEVPARRGFALRDALAQTQGGSSRGGLGVERANADGYDRIVVLTDGQWHPMRDGAAAICPPPRGSHAYMVNVATYKNAVGYGVWTQIDGWSEAVLTYIAAAEGAAPVEAAVEDGA